MKGSRCVSALLLVLAALPLFAQNQVKWSAELMPKDARAGESAQIVLTAVVEDTWHLYSIQGVKDGPAPTVIKLAGGPMEQQAGAIEPPAYRVKDPNFGVEVGYFTKTAKFGLAVRLNENATGEQMGKVHIQWMACNQEICTPPIDSYPTFKYTVAPGPVRDDHRAPVSVIPDQPAQERPPEPAQAPNKPLDEFQSDFQKAKSGGMLTYIWFCFLGGLLALLTPCVFPMIPITVSFFSKKNDNGKANVKGAVAYCLGIIGTFTALGVIVSAIFGATGINAIANNPWLNFGLAALFVVLGLSLMGVFELTLPSGLVNRASASSQSRTGVLGPILMGFTFTLTSFTCAVPIVGTLLAAAAGGSYVYPVVGMLAFSLAFAAPFFLLAIFPQMLAQMPKSGGWLGTTKAFLGFIEIFAAVKFLSNVDLLWRTQLMPRSVFLAVWTVIIMVCALWLMGWFRLPHDAGGRIGVTRRLFGIGTFAFGFWLLGGVGGKSLGELNAYLPPGNSPIPWVHEYQAALARSQSENKPVFINFTGVNCTNCRWMEANMFPRDEVATLIIKNFIPVELWTDRPTPEDRANQKIQLDTTHVVTLPIYAVVDSAGNPIKIFSKSTRNPEEFVAFLKSALEASKGN